MFKEMYTTDYNVNIKRENRKPETRALKVLNKIEKRQTRMLNVFKSLQKPKVSGRVKSSTSD